MLKKHDTRFIFCIAALAATFSAPTAAWAQEVATPAPIVKKAIKSAPTEEQIADWRHAGIAAYTGSQFIKQDYEKSRVYFEKAGGEGDAVSLYYLGSIYNEGLGVAEDEDKAYLLYRRAAEKGHADSQMLVAVNEIIEGITAPSETKRKMLYKSSVIWLEKSVAQGNTEAMFWLGDMLTKGLGTEKDAVRGRKLLEQSAAAENGNALAMLAAYYWRGLNDEKVDIAKAHLLMTRALNAGNEQAEVLLGKMEQELTPEEAEKLKKATQKALKNG